MYNSFLSVQMVARCYGVVKQVIVVSSVTFPLFNWAVLLNRSLFFSKLLGNVS
jgi:hypothetical protein